MRWPTTSGSPAWAGGTTPVPSRAPPLVQYKNDDPPKQGCDWTLGGMFQLHKLEVVTEDGEHYPRFEPCTPEEAQSHMKEVQG